MRPTDTLDRINKYMLYVSDALADLASSYGIDRHARQVLEKYSDDILNYSMSLEQLKQNIITQAQVQRKLQAVSELQFIHERRKQAVDKIRKNIQITEAHLREAKRSGNRREQEEYKQRLMHYTNEYGTAQNDEVQAKQTLERNVNG